MAAIAICGKVAFQKEIGLYEWFWLSVALLYTSFAWAKASEISHNDSSQGAMPAWLYVRQAHVAVMLNLET